MKQPAGWTGIAIRHPPCFHACLACRKKSGHLHDLGLLPGLCARHGCSRLLKLRSWKSSGKDVIGSGKAALFIAAGFANDVPDWSLDLPGFRCTQPRLR